MWRERAFDHIEGNAIVSDILLMEQTCFNSMMSLTAEVAQTAGRHGFSVDDQLVFAAYMWNCIKSASETNFTALALIAPGKDDDRHAKTHLRRQVLERFNAHFDTTLNVSKVLFGMLDDEPVQPFWYPDVPPNILSPIHLCAQSIHDEVSPHYFLANS